MSYEDEDPEILIDLVEGNLSRRRRAIRRRGRPGRPRVSLFHGNIVIRRKIILGHFQLWTWNPRLKARIDWLTRKFAAQPNWEIFRDAQLAMLAMAFNGRPWPEPLAKDSRSQAPLDQEALLFWEWLETRGGAIRPGARGPKPDLRTTWRTALALVVTSKILAERGRYQKAPSAREIAEVWFLLFGEQESRDKIKSRLPRCATLCLLFAEEQQRTGSILVRAEAFQQAGSALTKYGPKSTARRW